MHQLLTSVGARAAERHFRCFAVRNDAHSKRKDQFHSYNWSKTVLKIFLQSGHVRDWARYPGASWVGWRPGCSVEAHCVRFDGLLTPWISAAQLCIPSDGSYIRHTGLIVSGTVFTDRSENTSGGFFRIVLAKDQLRIVRQKANA